MITLPEGMRPDGLLSCPGVCAEVIHVCRGHLFHHGLQMSREQWYSLLRFFCISQILFVLNYHSWGQEDSGHINLKQTEQRTGSV